MNTKDAAIYAIMLISSIVAYAMGYSYGHRNGVAKGKAEGWCEHHFDGIAKDRARRNARGQFKTKGTL